MQSTVWFADLSSGPGNSLLDTTGRLLRAAGLAARIAPDVGILASDGPVAPDQACADLVIRAAGRDPFPETRPGVDRTVPLAGGEAVGLGTRGYRLEGA